MPDFRVADTAPEHPKLRAAGLPAAGLWSLAGAVSMRDGTDGWVPEYWVRTWPSGAKHAARLVEVRLWIREERLGIPGYRFHDWLSIQRSAAQIADEKAAARERARKSRQKSTARAPHGAPQRAENVHDSLSLSLSPGGPVGGEPSGTERAQPRTGAPPRCPRHADWPADQPVPACVACRDARLAAEAAEAETAAQAAELDRADRATRVAVLDACTRCDEHGWLLGDDGVVIGPPARRCTHPDQP